MSNSVAKNRLREFVPSTWGELNSMIDQVFGPTSVHGVQPFYVPGSMWEDDDSFHVELDVPGVERENVELTFEKGTLKIVTQRTAPSEERKGLVDQRRYGQSTHTVTLPDSVDTDSISAELINGVLHVTVAKKPETLPKRIEIK
ncbi:MAG: Hsp20/alpha crystallin family protein [Planctomycetales bacterium]|nr:Hsp20/alpha crystallin family protein [Planctomycetales bacterium]